MKVNTVNMNKIAVTFNGTKEAKKFRADAIGIINELNKVEPGSYKYNEISKNGKTLKERLWAAIHVDTDEIGKENITDADRKLHEELKSLYKKYQEEEDYMNAMCGGGHYVDRTIDYCI